MVVHGAGAYTIDADRFGGTMMQSNRSYNCDQLNFTRKHMDKCPAKGVTCKFCR